ncbi:putative bifunctional diguanylate cyclase/phosphodiesterase [Pleionea mediterranea]|uniref:Diguanylate cyclase (GGDEF)-like protein n=1 Tax=Pleionea mediterranea TaxID=523701 RepID=A0A316FBZ5_9GAMM|nr:EAL domain-containing protein [Pleionea mediterranea]PWK43605.1 diguanylate cyclase (GGDEF)-like protein [Pleionea mediterranea]
MKLITKINLILLPVVLLFALGFIALTYQGMVSFNQEQLEQQLISDLNHFDQKLGYERRYMLYDSRRIAVNLHGVFALKPTQRNQALQQIAYDLNSQGGLIDTIQLFNLQGELEHSSELTNQFSNIPRVPIESSVIEQANQLSADAVNSSLQSSYFVTLDKQVLFYSIFLVQADTIVSERKFNKLALIVRRQSVMDDFILQMKQKYGQSMVINFEPHQSSIASQAGQIDVTSDSAINITMNTQDFSLTMTLPLTYVQTMLPYSLSQIGFFVFFILIISYGLLVTLLYFNVGKPIHQLLGTIKSTRFGDDVKLAKKKGNSEINVLINTYIEMLNKMNRLAAFDSLTGLSNRRSFHSQFQKQLNRAIRRGSLMALLYIDLDNFKKVNDHYGHSTGDRLLKLFSERLQKSIRPSDVAANLGKGEIARLAGDEFSLLLTDIEGPIAAEKVADRILQMFDSGFQLDGVNHNVQASIGIVMIPDDGNDVQTLLQHADAAMYQAKLKGKNRLQFFNRDIAGGIQRKQYIERVLIKAIHHGHFNLVYMPIFDSQNLKPVGVEVLIRAPSLASKGIGPEEFIPVAETTGLIKDIDAWVLNESLSRITYLTDKYQFDGFFAINISAVELHNREFPQMVKSMLLKHQADPSRIELEITETSFVDNLDNSIRQLNHLKSLGVSLSLDDFGTGYTAFTQLIEFPVDKLKIDRSFIQGLDEGASEKKRMVDIVLALADLYQLKVVAEGVESEEQIEYLKYRGCEMLQGYFLSKPLSWDDFQLLIEQSHSSQTA